MDLNNWSSWIDNRALLKFGKWNSKHGIWISEKTSSINVPLFKLIQVENELNARWF